MTRALNCTRRRPAADVTVFQCHYLDQNRVQEGVERIIFLDHVYGFLYRQQCSSVTILNESDRVLWEAYQSRLVIKTSTLDNWDKTSSRKVWGTFDCYETEIKGNFTSTFTPLRLVLNISQVFLTVPLHSQSYLIPLWSAQALSAQAWFSEFVSSYSEGGY